MRKFVISLCLALSLMGGNVLAAPQGQGQGQVPGTVIAQVEQETGGRVLNAVVTENGYQLKVLMPGGRVRIIEVPHDE